MRQNIEANHRIDGLQNCTRLVELYLHSNKIRYIKNVSHLRDLKVLWLANNEIHQIEGLKECVQLKELNLAKNPISKLGDISHLKSLEKLNVAATNIGSFKVNHFYIKYHYIFSLNDKYVIDTGISKLTIFTLNTITFSCLRSYYVKTVYHVKDVQAIARKRLHLYNLNSNPL